MFAYQIFIAVVEQKSFALAAQRLYLTPSAVSQAILKLEQDYGIRLFVRSHHGAQLTSEGEQLLPYIRAIVDAEQQLAEMISTINEPDSGRISVGAFDCVCKTWLPEIVKSFTDSYPKIKLDIIEGENSLVLDWLRGGHIDVGFSTFIGANTDQYEMIPVFNDRIMCVTGINFQPQNPDYVTVGDLCGERLIFMRGGPDADTNALLKDCGLTISQHLSVENASSILAMIEGGFGICLMPELMLKKMVYNVSVFPVEPALFRTIVLATYKKRTLSAAAKKFHAHTIDYLQSNRITNI